MKDLIKKKKRTRKEEKKKKKKTLKFVVWFGCTVCDFNVSVCYYLCVLLNSQNKKTCKKKKKFICFHSWELMIRIMIYESQINIARKNYSYKCAPSDSTRGLLQKMSQSIIYGNSRGAS